MGVVLLNVGIIHRMGPHRFNAKLARALAREGWATLRMDLSGQGDSGTPDEALPYEQQAVTDLQATMDHFQRLCKVEKFAIAGICSGAYNGLAAALADHRVAALWMLDGYAYPTARTRWNRYTGQLREAPLRALRSWTRKLVRRAARAFRNVADQSMTQELWDFGQTLRRVKSSPSTSRRLSIAVWLCVSFTPAACAGTSTTRRNGATPSASSTSSNACGASTCRRPITPPRHWRLSSI